MLLAAIPAFSVGAASNPAIDALMDAKYYRTVITNETVIVDGAMDDVYKDSQKIYSGYNATSASFEAYTVVSPRGMYLFAEVKGDSFRVYTRMDDRNVSAWGYYEITKDGNVTVTTNGGTTLLEATAKVVTVANGWKAEIYIPFVATIINYTNYDLAIALSATSGSSTCYDRSEAKNAEESYVNYKPMRLVVWVDRSPDYAPNHIYSFGEFLTNDNIPTYGSLVNSAVYVENGGFSIDGYKDGMYSEHNKIPMLVWLTYHENGQPVVTPKSDLGYVYTAFDNENLYVYYERIDPDYTQNETFVANYYFDDGETITAGGLNFYMQWPSFGAWGSTVENNKYNWPENSTPVDSSSVTVSRSHNGDTHCVEYKMPLPEGIKAKLANGQDVSIKMSFSTKGLNANAGNTMLAGSYPNSENTYLFSEYGANFIDPANYGTTMILSKKFTEKKYGKFEGANLQLGSDITVNYYATIGTGDVNNTYVKFTREGCDTEYIAYPQKVAGSTMYLFAYKGLAPQTLGDEITAELYIDGKLVSTYDGYSARQNAINTLANKGSEVKLNNLIKSLLNYGAAAQKYADYQTDNLVSTDYKVELLTPTEADSVRLIGDPINDSTKLTALGVYFDSVNKMYVKFMADSLDGVTVTFNGVKADIEKSGNRYIAYSEAIPVSQFHMTYEIVLTTKDGSQTAWYSINSYAYAKLTSTDDAMVELAKATYTYGDCAKKYVGFSDTVYTVMTYNDADNNAPYKDLHDNVMTIVKESMPDLIGMQEVQQSQEDDYKSAFEAMNYGWLWVSRGASSGGDHYLGELTKPSGVAIAYNKDKFELVSNKHLWLSDTPNKASKYDDSDYTYDFHAALLKDKTTGEMFVFVSAHCDYTGSANVKQVAKLLELCENDNEYLQYAQYRKIYVADWNFGNLGADTGLNSAGAKIMYAAKYNETSRQIAGSYKPSTTANGATIDACFTKADEFMAIDYKVINTEYALNTSDHYPVLSTLVVKQEYENVLLTPVYEFPELPDDPTYDNFGDDFNTEDDTDGFEYN